MTARARKALIGLGLSIVLGFAVAVTQQVDNTLTPVDREYLALILGPKVPKPHAQTSSLSGELASIAAVQRAVLEVAPVNEGLPKGASREPKDLWEAKKGLCYDRSRVIEKALRELGFETRHIYIYSTEGKERFPLFTPGVRSHAITEVKTRSGWMVVDSNEPWISMQANGRPASIQDVHDDVGRGVLVWAAPFQGAQNDIYRRPFTFIHGLYSRHGGFYPPFTPVPDINWAELLSAQD